MVTNSQKKLVRNKWGTKSWFVSDYYTVVKYVQDKFGSFENKVTFDLMWIPGLVTRISLRPQPGKDN